jgi:lipopolysaccharide heptosyltransferase II
MSSARELWESAREVLCVRLDTIGDVLMTGPAIRALGPRRRVTLLTSPAGATVAQLMPEIDETIAYSAPWMKPTALRADAGQDREMVERLRARHFDAAVIFTVYSQSSLPAALSCLLAEVPLRLAYSRENPYGLLTDWVIEPEPDQLLRHEVRRQLDLVATVGAHTADERLRLVLPASARERVKTLLGDAGVDRGTNWVVVHPGATARSRRYPPELFARACQALAHEHHVQLVFSGDRDERSLCEDLRARAGTTSVSLAGELGVAELAALLEAAPLLLAGNTGPVHLAAAVATPVVDIYALTNPQHTPWQVPSRVLFNDVPCRWCYKSVCPEGHHLCLRGVEPEAVVNAAIELLHEPAGAAAPTASSPLELG